MKDNKIHKIGIRLTDSELLNLEVMMTDLGYNSKSKYIRDVLFITNKQRVKIKKIDTNITDVINKHTVELRRLGNNYNQYMRAINSKKEKLTSQYLIFYSKKMIKCTLDMIEEYKKVNKFLTNYTKENDN